MTYDAVVLDNDGVLSTMTDRSVMREAVRAAFEDVGVTDPDPEDVERLVHGVTPTDLESVAERYDLPPGEFWARRDMRSSLAQEQEIDAGRKTLYDDVTALDRLDHPLGIVSSNQHRTVEILLETYDLADRFETVYGREMELGSLDRKKPDPHYLELAFEDLAAENPIYVGDSECDVAAASAAGVDSVFIRRAHRADLDLSVSPTYEIESLDRLPELLS